MKGEYIVETDQSVG